MVRRYVSLGVALACLVFAALCALLYSPSAMAQGITQKVAVCNPAFVGQCIKPDANGAIPTTLTAAAAPSTNASTTVTTGGTYQTVVAASTSRKGCTIQNPTTATEILNVRVKATAVFTIPIGGSFNCGAPGNLVISDLIEVTATTTGHAFTATYQ